ncbi:hypothetical protein PSHI8_01140 [Polynucleobacter sp. SHI8]|uniref:hypothetical protein n=1 Tax=unclassified Polynucleobacter TaxID=2640945 RepID=UPI0024900E6E|nr:MULTISPECIES: hypothetical protein [unclassified Polynucleobacter]BDW10032.1 hypothetical protein PSHI2_01140 [Polynucleobacter sp. SHI2]BDW12478.1 hypothetical protein PSHI8_01140 [Polynucleobacter sp. SHI8]
MSNSDGSILFKFHSKDTSFGVTRATVKAIAKELDINETQAIHLALSKFAADIFSAYEADDGPLTTKQIKMLRDDAEKTVTKRESDITQRLICMT